MKIENNISSKPFMAKYINTVELAKSLNKASIVEIDAHNGADIKALRNTEKFWRDAKYVTNILYAADTMKNDTRYLQHNKIYAITTQNANFETLNDSKILGLVHINQADNKTALIEYIESNPEIINNIHREIKGIGSAMINYLKTIYNTILCSPSASKAVKNFYIKNGFKESPIIANLFVWRK